MAKRNTKNSPRSTKRPAPLTTAPSLDYIHEQLRPLAEPIESLVANPANIAAHDDAAIAAAARSLEAFDMRAVLVVRESDRMIVDGHARLLAAQRLGWSHLPVIWVDDDQAKAISYAIASRQTVLLSDWIESEALARALGELHDFDAGLFDVLQLDDLCDTAGDALVDDEPPPEVAVTGSYQVVIDCADEPEQQAIYEEQTGLGRSCKCLTI